ncbi:MAG TPA: hypothetical protein VLT84_00100, partial [Acidobacteriota bacterium]|nr:hypothetical protein [Acidobacteriota bacterium]
DPAAYDAFTEQWFAGKAMPEFRVTRATKEPASGGGYDVRVTVENRGTGTMPVEIAATAGERWAKGKNDYREARATARLGPGATATVAIRCDFEPSSVVVDPDVRVLQLNRKLATGRL